MIWRDKTGRYRATPPEHLIITRYMQRIYEYDFIKKRPSSTQNVAARKLALVDKEQR